MTAPDRGTIAPKTPLHPGGRPHMVLGLTEPAVDVLVDPARGPAREVGDDEARVGALRPGARRAR